MSVGSLSELRSSYQDCGVWHSARLYEKFAREPSRRFHSIFSFPDQKGFNFVAQVAVGVA